MHKWDETLWLFTPEEFDKLPIGTELTSINGDVAIKGVDYIDTDIRFGYIAYGVINPTTHPLAELFSIFILS